MSTAKQLTKTNQTADRLMRRLLQVIQHNYFEVSVIEQRYVIKTMNPSVPKVTVRNNEMPIVV
jgi:hypothetical protein